MPESTLMRRTRKRRRDSRPLEKELEQKQTQDKDRYRYRELITLDKWLGLSLTLLTASIKIICNFNSSAWVAAALLSTAFVAVSISSTVETSPQLFYGY